MRGLRLEGKGHGDDDLNHSSYFLFASSSDIPLPSAHLVLNSSRRLASSSLNHLSSSKSSSREVHVTIFPSGSILQYLSCLQLPVIPTISDLSPPHIQTFIKSPELSITQLNFFSASKTSLSYSSPRPFGHVLQYSHCFLRSSSWPYAPPLGACVPIPPGARAPIPLAGEPTPLPLPPPVVEPPQPPCWGQPTNLARRRSWHAPSPLPLL